MIEAGHSHAKATAPANIAAQRAFFNFSLFAARDKDPDPEVNVDLSSVFSGTTNNLSFVLSGTRDISEFTNILWESSCGGSFSPTNTQSTVFTAPTVSSTTPCIVTISLTDDCGKIYKASTSFNVQCGLSITNSITNPCGSNPTGGSITMDITNASGPYVVSWTRTSPAGSGGPTTLTTPPYTLSGLSAGTYSVTVTSNGGTGCSATFNAVLSTSPAMVINATPVEPTCPGGSNGSINVTVSGGTPGYSYAWSDGPTTLNRSGLSSASYTLTVTDSKGCTQTETVVLDDPDAIVINPSITDVDCYGDNTGAISLSVNGGTSPYTYLWNDGNSSPSRTDLVSGIYSVTVTDANN
ncbi:MAG: SprB repeat-containing protein, partial [Bacteroidales bacterium]|nr:SprB repeat-containing protein [Bacteroidales bacterium]